MQPLMNEHEIFVAGLNHQTAPVELRERFAGGAEQLPVLLEALRTKAGLREATVVSTCNRFEVYGVASAPANRVEAIFEAALGAQWPEVSPGLSRSIYLHQGSECIRHLFRVASSLDSLVVGETEIVGQVKNAYQAAQASGATGPALNRLFQKAFSVSKEVRTRTGIGRCSTSVGSVSVELAGQIFDQGLAGKTVLIIGAGKMSETTLRHLCKRGPETILVANRSYERALELARQFEGEAFQLEALPLLLPRADIVISSTSAPHFVLGQPDFAAASRVRGSRPWFVIDLAVPRDIDPAVGMMDGVFLYNVDQLSEVAQINRMLRRSEAAASEEAIATHVLHFSQRLFASEKAPARGVFGRSLGGLPDLSLGGMLSNDGCGPAPAPL